MKTNLLSPPYVDCCRNRVSCSARLASILASPPGLLIITPVDLLFTRPDTERPPITMLERRPMARSQFTPATPCNFISQGAGPTSRQIHDPNLPSDGFLPYLSVCPTWPIMQFAWTLCDIPTLILGFAWTIAISLIDYCGSRCTRSSGKPFCHLESEISSWTSCHFQRSSSVQWTSYSFP